MKNNKKTASLFLLLIATLSFSGCSIQKVEEAENKIPEMEESKEIKNIDSDNDGLLDSEENNLGTNKNNSDTDQDGLSDFEETEKWKTDPLDPDTDGDSYLDGAEVESGYDPLSQEG